MGALIFCSAFSDPQQLTHLTFSSEFESSVNQEATEILDTHLCSQYVPDTVAIGCIGKACLRRWLFFSLLANNRIQESEHTRLMRDIT